MSSGAKKRSRDDESDAAKAPKRQKTFENGEKHFSFSWSPAEVLSDTCGGNKKVAEAICALFDQGNSVPFIAR